MERAFCGKGEILRFFCERLLWTATYCESSPKSVRCFFQKFDLFRYIYIKMICFEIIYLNL